MEEIIVLPEAQSFFQQLIMFDANKGYAVSADYKLYYTEDGWDNHREVMLPAAQTEYPHIFSANSSGLIGFFTGAGNKNRFIIFREGMLLL
jgi:hypothetical protein